MTKPFSDALAEEMAPHDVKVSVIEPGNYDSNIAKNAVVRMGGPTNAGDRSQYKPPTEVAAAVEHALFDTNPKMRYMVVPNEQEAAMTISHALLRVAQQNSDQPYSFDRKKLIELKVSIGSRYRRYKPPFCHSSEESYPKSSHSFTVPIPIFAVEPAQIVLIRFGLAVKSLTDGSLDVSCSTGRCESWQCRH